MICDILCLVTKSCVTLCEPMDCSLPGPSVHGVSPGKNTGVGCYALLQGLFPTHRSSHGKFLHISSNFFLCFSTAMLILLYTVHRLHFFLYFNLLSSCALGIFVLKHEDDKYEKSVFQRFSLLTAQGCKTNILDKIVLKPRKNKNRIVGKQFYSVENPERIRGLFQDMKHQSEFLHCMY